MYRTSKNTESIESIIGDTWDIHSNEQVFGVRKLVLCASGPRAILLKIDCFKHPGLQCSSLYVTRCVTDAEKSIAMF